MDVTRREDLLVEACMKYDAAYRLRPRSHSTLYNWARTNAPPTHTHSFVTFARTSKGNTPNASYPCSTPSVVGLEG